MPGPCHGLRIIDFTSAFPGALATMVLADAGAEVVKVEPPGGDPTRRHYASVMWHRGKKSVVLDLKTAEGLAQARSLAAGAGVVIESFRPGVAKRLGIAYDDLSPQNPGLVYCSITAFGEKGPLAQVKGYEQVVHAKAGRMDHVWGLIPKDGPIYSALPITGYGAAMLAIQGVLAALIVRKQTGRGQRVTTSLVQALMSFDLTSWMAMQLEAQGSVPFRRGYAGGQIPPYMTALTKDGHWLQMANLTVDTMWNYMRALGLEWMLKDERYKAMPNYTDPKYESEVQRACLAKVLEKTRDEWMKIFMESDVACEPFRTTQEGMEHPQAIHNGNTVEIPDPHLGTTRQLGPIGKLAATPITPREPAPDAAQHQHLLAHATPSKPAAAKVSPAPKHPLSGVTVLEFASFIATPIVTCLLSDLGARVIKVEPVTGDLYRAIGWPRMCKTLQGKEALAIDIKSPAARPAIERLIAKADALIHNYRPGAPQRLGIDYESARKINPNIVYVYAGAYGSTGPHSHRTGFHPIAGAITGGPRYMLGKAYPVPKSHDLDEVQPMSNIMRRSNETNPDPTAALACATATMLALYHQRMTGQGQYVETSMLGGNMFVNADDALSYKGKPERRLPDEQVNGLSAQYRLYKTKHGWVFLACPKESELRAFAHAAGCERLLTDPRFATHEAREANDRALGDELEKVFATRPASEWERLLSAADVPCVEVSEIDHGRWLNVTPWVKDAGLFVPTSHPSVGGKYYRHGPPWTFSVTPPTWGPSIYLGEHTRAILKEVGYSEKAIDEMEAAGSIVCHQPEAAKA